MSKYDSVASIGKVNRIAHINPFCEIESCNEIAFHLAILWIEYGDNPEVMLCHKHADELAPHVPS